MNRILLIILLAVTPICYGSDLSWFGADKSKGPDTEYRKTENGFAGMLLVTSDTNWEEKWTTPSGSIPDFTDAETVRYGEELAVLTFFMNPKPDNRNNVDVECSLLVTRPNRTIAVYQQGITCMEGTFDGKSKSIRLSPAVLEFVAEKDDPAGTWVIDMEIRDRNRKTTLKLKTRFTLLASSG